MKKSVCEKIRYNQKIYCCSRGKLKLPLIVLFLLASLFQGFLAKPSKDKTASTKKKFTTYRQDKGQLNLKRAFEDSSYLIDHLQFVLPNSTLAIIYDPYSLKSIKFIKNLKSFTKKIKETHPEIECVKVPANQAKFSTFQFSEYPAVVAFRGGIAIPFDKERYLTTENFEEQSISASGVSKFLSSLKLVQPLIGSEEKPFETLNTTCNLVFYYNHQAAHSLHKVMDALKAKYYKKFEMIRMANNSEFQKILWEFSVPKETVAQGVSILSYRVSDQTIVSYRGSTEDRVALEHHVLDRVFPSIMKMNMPVYELYLARYFKHVLIYFYSEKDQISQLNSAEGDSEGLFGAFQRMANQTGIVPFNMRSSYQFVMANMDDLVSKYIYSETNNYDLPVLMLMDLRDRKIDRKYIFNNSVISRETIQNFLYSYQYGQIQQYFRSTMPEGLDSQNEQLNENMGGKVSQKREKDIFDPNDDTGLLDKLIKKGLIQNVTGYDFDQAIFNKHKFYNVALMYQNSLWTSQEEKMRSLMKIIPKFPKKFVKFYWFNWDQNETPRLLSFSIVNHAVIFSPYNSSIEVQPYKKVSFVSLAKTLVSLTPPGSPYLTKLKELLETAQEEDQEKKEEKERKRKKRLVRLEAKRIKKCKADHENWEKDMFEKSLEALDEELSSDDSSKKSSKKGKASSGESVKKSDSLMQPECPPSLLVTPDTDFVRTIEDTFRWDERPIRKRRGLRRLNLRKKRWRDL